MERRLKKIGYVKLKVQTIDALNAQRPFPRTVMLIVILTVRATAAAS